MTQQVNKNTKQLKNFMKEKGIEKIENYGKIGGNYWLAARHKQKYSILDSIIYDIDESLYDTIEYVHKNHIVIN